MSALGKMSPDQISDLIGLRIRLKEIFSNETLEGIDGKASFDEFGEIIGRESVPLLRVVSRFGHKKFERITIRSKHPPLTFIKIKRPLTVVVTFIAGATSFVASIIAIIVAIFG